MKTTYMPKKNEVERNWIHIDAKGKTLGRLASSIANLLRGKHKPTYTPHFDCGDFVVITNADKIIVTGHKMEDKVYHSHSGYPGGHKEITLSKLLAKHPERIIEKAVKGMLPHNRLGRALYGKLYVYKGEAHPHQAQKPQNVNLSEEGELLKNG